MKILETVLFRRPRILDLLHRIHVVRPTSQTIEAELELLERHARGAHIALEIGSYQGVSAVRIAAAMGTGSMLYCIDPWPSPVGQINACYAIFKRHVHRAGMTGRIKVLRMNSAQIGAAVPNDLDFIFVDGDHSWQGIKTDWRLVRQKLCRGGIVCLHDSFVPPGESWRRPDSVRFFEEVIAQGSQFNIIDRMHSLAVLRKTPNSEKLMTTRSCHAAE